MSYQVLARKWRPKSFQETVGQTPVLQALGHALRENRVHHAYLLTGTRGVGKTSIARILAKCLSCFQGITDTPCGVCEACVGIDQGRFLDLIEIDAASRTKVEDTRDLLDNVQYAPSLGRFKIYLIDEVHMLSSHSFNALLKTLEEPPEHVKFILCTTDPQKLPVTVISRCCHLALKPLQPLEITRQLEKILTAENIVFDPQAIALLSEQAQGSLRDALSLLDQAISVGNGQVTVVSTRLMLGVAENSALIQLLQHLIHHRVTPLCELLQTLLSQGIQGSSLLETLARMLTDIAHLHLDPTWQSTRFDTPSLQEIAQTLAPEHIQLWYQIALLVQKDLDLAPDPQVGLEMALMRMMAFVPVLGHADKPAHPHPNPPPSRGREPEHPLPTQKTSLTPPPSDLQAFWQDLTERSTLSGMIRPLARHSAPIHLSEEVLTLALDPSHTHLLNPRFEAQLQEALKPLLNGVLLKFQQTTPSSHQSPAALAEQTRVAQHQALKTQMLADPVVQFAQENLEAVIIETSLESKNLS